MSKNINIKEDKFMLELFLGIGALVATVITANKLRTIGKTKMEILIGILSPKQTA